MSAYRIPNCLRLLPVLILLLASFCPVWAQENCTNGIDDDGDGFVDCNDPDCQGPLPAASIFNTGSNGNGGTLPAGAIDSNWTISSTGLTGNYVPAIVLGPPTTNPYVVSPWPDAQWISGNIDALESQEAFDPASSSYIYYYRLTFQLPCENGCGGDISDNFCVEMDFFADNAIMNVFVNDVQQPNTPNMSPSNPGGYYGFHAANAATITLCDDWQPGLNTITVRTLSGGGLQGFLAQLNPDFEPVDPGNPPTADIDSVFYVCGAQPVAVYATGYDTTDILHWNTGSSQDTIYVSTPGTYTLIVTNDCGTDTVSTLVKTLNPTAHMGTDTAYICGSQPVNLHVMGYASGDSILWSTGDTQATVAVTAPGTYSATVSNDCGSTTVSTLVLPIVPAVHMDSLFYICSTQTIPLFPNDYPPGSTFLWSDGSTGDTLFVNSPGTYSLTVTDACGSTTASTQVQVQPLPNMSDIPNAFSPNFDGINDVYTIGDLFTYSMAFNSKIYNRWGAKMYDTQDKQINWSPKNISDGVYFLVIFYTDCGSQEEQTLAKAITVFTGR